MTGKNINTPEALLRQTNESLVNDNNDIGYAIKNVAPKGFHGILILDESLIPNPKHERIVRESFAEAIKLLGGTAYIKTESGNRFEDSTQMTISDISERNPVHQPLHPNDMTTNAILTNDSPYAPLEQFQNNLRVSTRLPVVAVFLTRDPVRYIRFIKGATISRRGLRAVLCFTDPEQKTGNIPSIGSDLGGNFALNIFLNVLQSGIHEELGITERVQDSEFIQNRF